MNMDIEKHLQELCGGNVNFLWIDYADIDYPPEAAKNGHKVCCAIKIVDDGEKDDIVMYRFAFAFCSPRDHFEKKTGRIVALRKLYRLLTGADQELQTLSVSKGEGMHREIHQAVRNRLKFRVAGMPRWAWDIKEGA